MTLRFKMILIALLYASTLVEVKAQSNASMVTPVYEVFNNSRRAIENSRNISCVEYEPTGTCMDRLSGYYDYPVKIAVNRSRAESISVYQMSSTKFSNFLMNASLNANQKCLDALVPFVCRWVFSTCDPAFNKPVEQSICRRACETLTIFVCPEVSKVILEQASIIDFMVLSPPKCDGLINANGGDAPDCIDSLDGGDIPQYIITNDCFNGRGRGYNGTINITRSGKTCQHWSVQAPHQFILPSSQYPEIAGDHNYCRNPGSRGPEGPWCFTTDNNTRWEYCNVPKCGVKVTCELYHNNTPNSVCFGYGSIGYDYVFLNKRVDVNIKDTLNCKLKKFNDALHKTHEVRFPSDCVEIVFGLMCHHSFPLCDYDSDTPKPRKVCRSYCEEVSTGRCSGLWDKLKRTSSLAIITLPNCEDLPSSEGGDYPECFIPYNNGRSTRDINATNCYTEDDLGINYNGTVNVTESGKHCQKWDSDKPHRHPFTSLFRYYLEGHNYCRNPEGRGERPWCYTTDPTKRWEYCNISQCVGANTPSSDNGNNSVLLGVVITIPVLFIIVVILVVVICALWIVIKRREHARYLYTLNKSPSNNSSHEETICNSNYVPVPAVMGVDRLPIIPRENITHMSELGQGNFGKVMKGEVKDIFPDQSSTLVAIKMLKEGSNGDARNDFVREAVLVNQFDHPNILKLLGVCFNQEPFFITFEYMELGDLNKHLRNKAISVSQSSSNLTVQQLLDMAINIAAGLEYLAEHHFVHRDLATRNCLINDQFLVKIADFGLSKDVYSKDYYRLGEKSLLPIRWMPPEAILYCKFSTQSDIWSFGIVLWEIFAGGAQPYYTLSNEEVVDYVTERNVLQCPSGCPSQLYKLMVDCWEFHPESRPKASEVRTRLQDWSPQTEETLLPRNGSLTLNQETTV